MYSVSTFKLTYTAVPCAMCSGWACAFWILKLLLVRFDFSEGERWDVGAGIELDRYSLRTTTPREYRQPSIMISNVSLDVNASFFVFFTVCCCNQKREYYESTKYQINRRCETSSPYQLVHLPIKLAGKLLNVFRAAATWDRWLLGWSVKFSLHKTRYKILFKTYSSGC